MARFFLNNIKRNKTVSLKSKIKIISNFAGLTSPPPPLQKREYFTKLIRTAKKTYRLLSLFGIFLLTSSAVFSQVSVAKFPKNNQVFQRNDQNEAIVEVKGQVTENNHTSISLAILRDGNSFSQQNINLNSSGEFTFSPNLQAGNFNYTFTLILDGNQKIKESTQIAIGDLILVYGQSNALGNGGIDTYWPARNPLIRFFSVANFNNGDSEWVLPYLTSTWPGTGTSELLKFLCEKYNYPVGVIVASVGGSDIRGLNNRNNQNPSDKNTYYGQMLLQTTFADAKEQIKYIIFRHGESDGSYPNESQQYPLEFEKLYKNLNIDYTSLRKIYNVQTNILTGNNQKAGFLRDFQRKTKYLYPKITTMSTVGTKAYDGLHYRLQGYSQTAFELARIIGREVYQSNESVQVYSPDIKRIYWENQKLVLEFDEGMEMIYPQDSTASGRNWSMKENFYIDGKNDMIESGIGIGNKIYLTVNNNADNARSVSYLPNAYGSFGTSFFDGVHLKNRLGMRAFSFDNVAIGGEPPVIITPPAAINLSADVNENVEIKLSWNGNNQTKYHIERSENNIDFAEISVVNASSFTDFGTSIGKKYYYRVFAENNPNTKSNTKEISLLCLENVNLKTIPDVSYVGAKTSISTIVSITNTKQLSLTARKSIDLNHGFDAELGSDFSADISGCKNN